MLYYIIIEAETLIIFVEVDNNVFGFNNKSAGNSIG